MGSRSMARSASAGLARRLVLQRGEWADGQRTPLRSGIGQYAEVWVWIGGKVFGERTSEGMF